MNLSGLLPLLRTLPAFQELVKGHTSPPQKLYAAARAFVIATVATDREGPVLVLTGTAEQAQNWVERLELFLPPADGAPHVSLYAEPDALPFERIPWAGRTRQLRLTALAALQQKSSRPTVVVASARAVMQKTLPARAFRMALRPLRVGSFVQLDELTGRWAHSGYEPVQVVEEPGTFARRGGIVDIWPPNLSHPVRIDLFGDEVETLRAFDPTTQRSERQLQRVLIGPGSEALGGALSTGASPQAAAEQAPTTMVHHQLAGSPLVQATLEEVSGSGEDSEKHQTGNARAASLRATLLEEPNLVLAIREEITQELEDLGAGRTFRGIEWYLPYFYSRPASLLEHLPKNGLLAIDDGEQVAASLKASEEEAARTYLELIRGYELPAKFHSSFFSSETLLPQIEARNPLVLGANGLPGEPVESESSALARLFVPSPHFAGQTKRILQEMRKFAKSTDRVVLISRQTARLQEELREAQVAYEPDPRTGQTTSQRNLALAGRSAGRVCHEWPRGSGGRCQRSPACGPASVHRFRAVRLDQTGPSTAAKIPVHGRARTVFCRCQPQRLCRSHGAWHSCLRRPDQTRSGRCRAGISAGELCQG